MCARLKDPCIHYLAYLQHSKYLCLEYAAATPFFQIGTDRFDSSLGWLVLWFLPVGKRMSKRPCLDQLQFYSRTINSFLEGAPAQWLIW